MEPSSPISESVKLSSPSVDKSNEEDVTSETQSSIDPQLEELFESLTANEEDTIPEELRDALRDFTLGGKVNDDYTCVYNTYKTLAPMIGESSAVEYAIAVGVQKGYIPYDTSPESILECLDKYLAEDFPLNEDDTDVVRAFIDVVKNEEDDLEDFLEVIGRVDENIELEFILENIAIEIVKASIDELDDIDKASLDLMMIDGLENVRNALGMGAALSPDCVPQEEESTVR